MRYPRRSNCRLWFGCAYAGSQTPLSAIYLCTVNMATIIAIVASLAATQPNSSRPGVVYVVPITGTFDPDLDTSPSRVLSDLHLYP